MLHFGTALRDALDAVGWSQSDLARKLGWQTTRISKYTLGQMYVGKESMQEVVDTMPAETRGDLIAAWLRERVPTFKKHVVQFQIYGPGSKPPTIPPDLPADVRQAIETLGAAVATNPSLAKTLLHLGALVRGKPIPETHPSLRGRRSKFKIPRARRP